MQTACPELVVAMPAHDALGGGDAVASRAIRNGRSQAVRLPREFRFDRDRVRARRAGRGVLMEPMFMDVIEWFSELTPEWIAFDEEDAREAGIVRAGLERAGKPIGAYDVLIAGQARRRRATVVTSNARVRPG